MKISTIIATALLAVSPIVNALPAASHAEEDHISDAAKYQPIHERDIHDGPVIRGAGYLQEQHLRRREERLKKRNTSNQRITGVRVGYTGAYRVYRQEIRKFRDDRGGRVHDLFLLALNRMMARPASDVNSYWQLAGVHGRPFQGWAGDSSGSWNQNGYCTHGSTLFPTWHRPYLAYFEEVVWANAEYIVNNVVRWQDRDDWRNALMVLRLPYYDFTIGGRVSDAFLAQTWTLRKAPNGQSSPYVISNPLFSGKFPGGTYNNAFPGNPWNLWAETKRAPPGTDNPSARNRANAPSDMTAFNSGLQNSANNLRDRVYQLLMNNNRWNTFSNRVGNNGQAPDSLESIHDTVHGLIGRSGHMSYVEYSAHDPIFFILHCNVDRLFAIWQAINPTTYVTSQVNQGGTYGVPPGSVESRTSILRPFKGLSGQYWTSDGVRDTSLFGYGYFETPKWKYNKASEAEYARVVRRTVENLYGNNAFASAEAMRKRDIGNATEAGLEASVTNNRYYEWRIDITADKSEGNGTYFVLFFLGKPSKNSEDWLAQKELVGSYACFTHMHQAAPGVDPATIDNTVSGSVPLTRSMIEAFGDTELNSLAPEEAATFLIKNLRWRATTDGGAPIRLRKLKGLKVSISINLVTLPTAETPFRVFGEWTHLTDITRRIGRDGGPDKVNVIPDLSSSAAPISSTAAPTSTSAPAVEEVASTTPEAATSTIESTSSEEPTPTETSA